MICKTKLEQTRQIQNMEPKSSCIQSTNLKSYSVVHETVPLGMLTSVEGK
jgi:hypothetical protein